MQTHCSVLVSEVHSVLAVPEHWRHPVSLLLQERNSSPQGKQEGKDALSLVLSVDQHWLLKSGTLGFDL